MTTYMHVKMVKRIKIRARMNTRDMAPMRQ
jgi:hypothetical protein